MAALLPRSFCSLTGVSSLTGSFSIPPAPQSSPSPSPPGPWPSIPAHPVPQVGGGRLPVQLGEGVFGQGPQVRMQQLRLRPVRVGHHLAVGAQQGPTLHVHELWAHRWITHGREAAAPPAPRPGLPLYLSAGMGGAPAVLCSPEAEASGAALGVSSVQGEGPKAALVAPWALHILLRGDGGGDKGQSAASPEAKPCHPLTPKSCQEAPATKRPFS